MPAGPDWCAGHHETLWADAGWADIDGLCMLCHLHLREVHFDWRLERRPDGEVR